MSAVPSDPIPPDCRRRVHRDFNDGTPAALAALDRFAQDHAPTPRVIRCVIVAAGGDLLALDRAIALAVTDARDAIMVAEYEAGTDRRLRDLSRPFDE